MELIEIKGADWPYKKMSLVLMAAIPGPNSTCSNIHDTVRVLVKALVGQH